MTASEFDNQRYMYPISERLVVQAGDAVLHHCYGWDFEDCVCYSGWLDAVPMAAHDAMYLIRQWLVDHDSRLHISLEVSSFDDVNENLIVPLAHYMRKLERYGYDSGM